MTLCVEYNSEWQWLCVEDRRGKSRKFENTSCYGQVSECEFVRVDIYIHETFRSNVVMCNSLSWTFSDFTNVSNVDLLQS